jgi:hypothetical protein
MKTKTSWILSLISVSVIVIVIAWIVVQSVFTTNESTQKEKTNTIQSIYSWLPPQLFPPYPDESHGDFIKSIVDFMPENSFRGLKSIQVVVDKIRPEDEKYGLTSESLQTEIELWLRKYGIKVVSQKELEEQYAQRENLEKLEKQLVKKWIQQRFECGILHLYVDLRISEEINLAIWTISVELRQPVLLARNPALSYWATTWEKRWSGGDTDIRLNKLKSIRESVENSVGKFIKAYNTSNPKERSATVEQKDTK